MPNPPCEAGQGPFPLRKQVENTRSNNSGSNSDARITNPQYTIIALFIDGQPDMTALVGVFCCVGQQVHNHLLQPGSVGTSSQIGCWGNDTVRFLLALVNQKATRLHRPFHDATYVTAPVEVEPFLS